MVQKPIVLVKIRLLCSRWNISRESTYQGNGFLMVENSVKEAISALNATEFHAFDSALSWNIR